MYLYRKPKTQRRCSKPATDKQRKQRFLAWMLFRVMGMQIPSTPRDTELSYALRIQLLEARQELSRLQRAIRKELQEL